MKHYILGLPPGVVLPAYFERVIIHYQYIFQYLHIKHFGNLFYSKTSNGAPATPLTT